MLHHAVGGVDGGSSSSQVEINIVFVVVYILVHRVVAAIVQIASRSRSRYWLWLLGSLAFSAMNSTRDWRGGLCVGIFVPKSSLG